MMSSTEMLRLLGGDFTDSWMHAQALISLNAMYDKQRCAGQAVPCEAEFRAYHLLTLIGTHGRYRYDATEYQGALAVSLIQLLMVCVMVLFIWSHFVCVAWGCSL